jgi:hypothetical protein
MVRLVLLRLLESYFRRPILTLLPILLFSVLGILYLLNQEPVYLANGKLRVEDQISVQTIGGISDGGFSWTTLAQQTVNQFENLTATDAFIRAVISQTDLEAELLTFDGTEGEFYDQVREDLWAAPIGEDQFGVVGRSTNPEIATQLVVASIESFLQWNINTELKDSNVAVDFYAQQVSDYLNEFEQRQGELREFLRAHPEPDRGERPAIEQLEINRLQALADDAAKRYTNARDSEERAKLQAAQTESAVRVKYTLVDAPNIPEDSEDSLTQKATTLIIFGVLGGLITLGWIVGSALLDRTFRYPIDVRSGLELPVLAAIPPGERFVSRHLLHLEQEDLDIPEPPIYRARLVPNVEPPTLIILPSEKAELERIKQERNEYEQQYGARRQERNDIHGVPSRHVDIDARPHGVPETSTGTSSNRSTSRRPVDLGDRNGVRDLRNGHASDEGDRTRPRI